MKTRSHIRFVGALMLFAGFSMFGCGSSGADTTDTTGGAAGGGNPPSPCQSSLCASGLSVVTAVPRVGYRLKVNTGIVATEAIDCPPVPPPVVCGTGGAGDSGGTGGAGDACGTGGAGGEPPECVGVTVSYYALNREDVDDNNELIAANPDGGLGDPLPEVRQFFLATVTFRDVALGDAEYEADFKVPLKVVDGNGLEAEFEPDDYYIQYIIDPDQRVTGDSGRADNSCSFDENAACSLTAVTLAPIGNPNLFIEELTLDSSILELYNEDANDYTYGDDVQHNEVDGVQDEHDSDAGGTLIVGLEGSREPLDVTVFAYLRIKRADKEEPHDVPLYLWDSVAQKYVNAYGGPPDHRGAPEGLLIGTLSPQMVPQAEEGFLELPTSCESTDCAPGLEQLPDDGRVEMVTGTDDTEELQASDRTSVHLDLYYPGGLAEAMFKIVNALPPPPPCDPAVQICAQSAMDEAPTVAPPDLTVAAIKLSESFFDGATKKINESCCLDSTGEPISFSIVAKVVCGTSGFGQVVDDDLGDNEKEALVELMLLGKFRPPADNEAINDVSEKTEAGFGGERFRSQLRFRFGCISR